MKFINTPSLKFFDGGFPSAGLALMQGSNVYDLGGYSGNLSRGNELEAVSSDCLFYGQYIAATQRLTTYRNNDLVKTILGLYFDAVSTCIHFNSENVVDIKDEPELTKLVNDSFKEIKYLDLLKEDLKDMIYYGSVAHKLVYNGASFKVKDLKYPFTTGYFRESDKYIVMSDKGPEYIENIIRFGFDDLRLTLDQTSLQKLELMTKEELDEYNKDKSSIYSLPKITCSEQLLLANELKIKDYVLKDLISSFLSLIDLIQQDTFTIDGQRITDSVNLIKLCDKVKGLLVTKDDMNLLASTRLDKTALIRRLFDRVRVIPSIAGELQGMQKLEGTDLRSKLDSINSQKESCRDDLLTSIGFPMDIYRGGTTKWEAGRQNDRYGIRTTQIKNAAINSTVSNARTIIKNLGGNKNVQSLQIETVFTELTPYEISDKIQKTNNSRDFLTALQDLIRTGSDMCTIESLQNPKEIERIVNNVFRDAGLNVNIQFKSEEEQVDETDENI